ncbi:hypothetical protein GCM10027176_38290 [Actinoallomurus bryophytorum]
MATVTSDSSPTIERSQKLADPMEANSSSTRTTFVCTLVSRKVNRAKFLRCAGLSPCSTNVSISADTLGVASADDLAPRPGKPCVTKITLTPRASALETAGNRISCLLKTFPT